MDYFQMLTGDCELISIKNPRNESETLSYYKLLNPRKIISCIDCLHRPEIQRQLQSLFSSVP